MTSPSFFFFFSVCEEINFQCLGDWIGHNGERYMALLDVQDSATTAMTAAGGGGVGIVNGAERRPRYRCAVRYPIFYFIFYFYFLLSPLCRSRKGFGFLFYFSRSPVVWNVFEFPSRLETIAEMRRRISFFPTNFFPFFRCCCCVFGGGRRVISNQTDTTKLTLVS